MEFVEGILKIANLFLSFVAAVIAISLFRISGERRELKPWKILVIVLVFFMLQMVLGALRAFKLWETPYLTHIIPTIMLALLIYTLILQINNKTLS